MEAHLPGWLGHTVNQAAMTAAITAIIPATAAVIVQRRIAVVSYGRLAAALASVPGYGVFKVTLSRPQSTEFT